MELAASGHLAYDALGFVSLRFPLPAGEGGGFWSPNPLSAAPEFG